MVTTTHLSLSSSSSSSSLFSLQEKQVTEKDHDLQRWRVERDQLVAALEVQLSSLISSNVQKDKEMEELKKMIPQSSGKVCMVLLLLHKSFFSAILNLPTMGGQVWLKKRRQSSCQGNQRLVDLYIHVYWFPCCGDHLAFLISMFHKHSCLPIATSQHWLIDVHATWFQWQLIRKQENYKRIKECSNKKDNSESRDGKTGQQQNTYLFLGTSYSHLN